MDVKSEDTENFVIMWELLNQCLQKLTNNKSYKFNPTGWMADENSANWQCIEEVLGTDALSGLTSCKFHFLQAQNQHRGKILADKEKETFKDLTEKLLGAKTHTGYMKTYDVLHEFVRKSNIKKE